MLIELFKQSAVAWKPHGYMKKASKFLLEHACAALFLDPGLGKTSITLAAIKMLIKMKLVDKVLLIAPLRVCYNVWPKEIQKWKDFNHLRIEILHGKDKDAALARDADIYVINPEGLEWLLQIEKKRGRNNRISVSIDLRRWKSLGFDMLVIDELSKFKNTNSVRFKAMKLVLHTFKRRWGLTGSPASNGLLDLFGQCYMLDQGRSLGEYISHFRSKYFKTVDKMGYVWVPQEGAEQQIYERLSPLALRMSADDYLDMPKVVVNNIWVQLPPKVMEIYDRLHEDLITSIDNNVVVATNAAVASGKCRQVANGGLYLDPEVTEMGLKFPKSKREWVDLHTEKVDALADLIDELQGSPLLVAYDFAHDLARLRDRFPDAVFACDYGMADFSKLENLWNAGEIPVLFGHPQSIGHGLNLQESGCHVAWHSMTWDYELYDQFIRRILRQGNKSRRIFVHHILAENTIDEVMLYTTKRKERGQQALFNGLKELGKKRRK